MASLLSAFQIGKSSIRRNDQPFDSCGQSAESRLVFCLVSDVVGNEMVFRASWRLLCSHSTERLEALSHEGGVHELFELCPQWVEGVAIGVEGLLQKRGGSPYDEGFLALQAWVGESVF